MMKKKDQKNREQKGTSDRLTLRRETILALDEPVLLELAKGGGVEGEGIVSSGSYGTNGC